MPWRDPVSVPFRRLQISAYVPAVSGVYGILDEGECLLIGESWNLRGRLLELAAALSDYSKPLTLVFELCPDEDRFARQEILQRELVRESGGVNRAASPVPSGISFRIF